VNRGLKACEEAIYNHYDGDQGQQDQERSQKFMQGQEMNHNMKGQEEKEQKTKWKHAEATWLRSRQTSWLPLFCLLSI